MSKSEIQPGTTQLENLEAQYDNTSVVKAVNPNELPVVTYKTRMKVAWRLIPILSIIYSLSVIDRINIGQAKVVGMSTDLDLIESRYNIALLLFFPGYLIGELPGNMALVKFGIANTLAFLTIGLGVFTLAQGHQPTWIGLTMMRLFIGLFEGSIFPAIIYIMASWYPRYQVHSKVAILYSIGLVASAFAGVLAYALALMDGLSGWKGWRWIFTIEGAFTSAFGIIAWFLIVDFPDRAKFLTEEERDAVLTRLTADRGDVTTTQITGKNMKDLKDWTLWLVTFMYFCNVVAVYGLAYFVPSILVGLGYSGLIANLYSAPPYVVALGFLIISSFIADRIHRRLPIIIVQSAIGIVGLGLMSRVNGSPQSRYAGVCLAIAACQSNNAAILIFGQNNVVGSSKMSLASVLNIAGGTIAGVIGSTIYVTKEAPGYRSGLITTMVLMGCLILCCIVANIVLHLNNRKVDRGEVVYHGVQGWKWTL